MGSVVCMGQQFCGADGQWYSVPAEPMPDDLQRIMDLHKESFAAAEAKVSSERLYASLPLVLPKTNLVNFEVPGFGKYDVEAANAGRLPVLTQQNWWLFAKAVADQEPALLHDLLVIAERRLAVYAPASAPSTPMA